MSRTKAQHLLSRFPWTRAPFIVGAPMRVFSGAELALTISSAGGLGFIGPNTSTKLSAADLEEAVTRYTQLRQDYQKQQQQQQQSTNTSDAASSNSNPKFFDSANTNADESVLPVGIGFQLWSDDLDLAAELVQKHRPCAVWLYAPTDEKHYQTWMSRLRDSCPTAQIWIQIGTVGEVTRLLESTGKSQSEPQEATQQHFPDVLVVQGAEAGGHGRSTDGIGLTTLLPEIADLLHRHNINIPLIAAGGLADARGAASALCLGATGIAMGTRFLATPEARIPPGYQREIVRATDGAINTTRTLLYNHMRGTFGWPAQYAPRTIINRSFVEFSAGERTFDELKVLHDDLVRDGGGERGWGPEGRLATYAGASVGLINEVKGAGVIVRDVQRETLEVLDAARQASVAVSEVGS